MGKDHPVSCPSSGLKKDRNSTGTGTIRQTHLDHEAQAHQQSIISLEILESPFLKKRWFLEHLELI